MSSLATNTAVTSSTSTPQSGQSQPTSAVISQFKAQLLELMQQQDVEQLQKAHRQYIKSYLEQQRQLACEQQQELVTPATTTASTEISKANNVAATNTAQDTLSTNDRSNFELSGIAGVADQQAEFLQQEQQQPATAHDNHHRTTSVPSLEELEQTTTQEISEQLQQPHDSVYNRDLQYKKALQQRLPKTWVIVMIFAMIGMLMPFCIDMYLGSFPVMAQEFNVPIPKIEFSLSIYFIGIALGQFVWGPLSDSIGRRIISIIAFACLTLTSVVIAQIHNLQLMYALRFVQGFFCASLLITMIAILRDIYDTREFVRINGLVTIIFFAAPFLAPLIGSYIALYTSWHYIFYAIGTMSLLTLVLFIWFIPETINPMFKRKLEFGKNFITMGKILIEPQSFWLIASMGFVSCIIFTYVSMASAVYQTYYGITPELFPYLFMINIIGQSTFNIINTKFVKRVGPDKLLRYGIIWMLAAAGYNILASLVFGVGFWGIVLGILLAMSASPLVFLNSIGLYLEIHYKHSGTATSLVNVARWLMPGLATMLAQQIDPYQGHTMLFLMAVFALAVAGSYKLFRYYQRKAQATTAPSH